MSDSVKPQAAPAPAQPIAVDHYGNPISSGGVPVVTAQSPVFVTQPPVVRVVANNANIRRDAQGNALCNKCSAPYPLPEGATSWRCRQCSEFNDASIYGPECPCCTIL
ncbi:Aste57867_12048 [Aphanomyces stellatus]|uniref:Aste57867_12048 protein n=1 Tax=Aphanomyces stellatus TaxID=120398 RepID=A0A485KVC3_9STRA|nr:hypothetical protein As57867_012003 [Aphanomyces stellatus]VFT88903.1 Aste57867_12048 [Aphanomyces stellatus]